MTRYGLCFNLGGPFSGLAVLSVLRSCFLMTFLSGCSQEEEVASQKGRISSQDS